MSGYHNRYQLNVTLGELLKEAILFSAARDGMGASTKARQILTQALSRTIASAEFQEHIATAAARQSGTSDATA